MLTPANVRVGWWVLASLGSLQKAFIAEKSGKVPVEYWSRDLEKEGVDRKHRLGNLGSMIFPTSSAGTTGCPHTEL